MSRLARRRGEESGVSLVLVLVALTVFGLLVPVLGQFGSVNGVSAYVVKGQRFDRYAADSGMQAAIAWARQVRTAGRNRVPCPDITTGLLSGSSGAFDRSVSVQCRGFQGSGVPQSTGSIPQFAVHALDNGVDEDGIEVLGSGRLRTRGAWWSDTGNPGGAEAISVNGVDVNASDDFVGGKGPCAVRSGGSLTASPLWCDNTRFVPEPVDGWTSNADSIDALPIQDVPGCPSDNGVVVLQPGFYWDRAGLERLTDGRSCDRDIAVQLLGGTYYFDFDFYDSGVVAPWTIGGGEHRTVIVGGEPTGWNPGAGDAVDQAAAAIGNATSDAAGACADGTGPQLIFGSDAQMVVDAPARMELCSPGGSGQRVSLFGQRENEPTTGTHTARSVPDAGTVTTQRGTFDMPPNVPASTLADSECVGTESCDAPDYVGGTLSGPKAHATIDLRLPNQVPRSGRVDSVTLFVDHREASSNPDRLDSLHVSLTDGQVTVNCGNRLDQDLSQRDGWHEDRFTCDNGPGRPLPAALGEFHVEITLVNGDAEDREASTTTDFALDHVRLEASYTLPTLRRQSGCVTTAECRWFFVDNQDASGAEAAHAWVRGTVYTTLARVRLRMNHNAGVGLTRGVVARNIQIDDPTDTDGYSPVSLPDGGSYTDRLVTFEAIVGDDSSPTLTARVRFCDPQPPDADRKDGASGDPDGCPDVPAGSAPRIISWEPKK
jgi:hypothetical protein